MAKFHINPETGNPGECTARAGRCPYGAEAPHYGSAEEARTAFEASMSSHPAGKLRKTPTDKSLDGFTVTQYAMNISYVAEGDRFITDEGVVYEALADSEQGEVKLGVVDPETGKVSTGGHVPVSWDKGPKNQPSAFKVLDHNSRQGLRTISDAELGERIASALNAVNEAQEEGLPAPMTRMNDLLVAGSRRGKETSDYVERGDDGVWRANAGLDKKPYRTYVDGPPGYSESRAIKEIPQGSTTYETAAIGSISYVDENGEPGSIRLFAPISGNVTKTKRIELARQLFAFTGRDPQEFEDAGEAAQERFYTRYFSRHSNVRVERSGDNINYDYNGGGGAGYDARSFKLVEL